MYIVIRNIRKGTSYKYELYTAQELNLSKTQDQDKEHSRESTEQGTRKDTDPD